MKRQYTAEQTPTGARVVCKVGEYISYYNIDFGEKSLEIAERIAADHQKRYGDKELENVRAVVTDVDFEDARNRK